VLYIGDLDLSGNYIEANTRTILEREIGRSLWWLRVAITETQTEVLRANGVKPITKTDHRFADRRPHLAFEAEALGQAALEAIVPRVATSCCPRRSRPFMNASGANVPPCSGD
jgi:hypothetical protein